MGGNSNGTSVAAHYLSMRDKDAYSGQDYL